MFKVSQTIWTTWSYLFTSASGLDRKDLPWKSISALNILPNLLEDKSTRQKKLVLQFPNCLSRKKFEFSLNIDLPKTISITHTSVIRMTRVTKSHAQSSNYWFDVVFNEVNFENYIDQFDPSLIKPWGPGYFLGRS